jgi:hypothetical protein
MALPTRHVGRAMYSLVHPRRGPYRAWHSTPKHIPISTALQGARSDQRSGVADAMLRARESFFTRFFRWCERLGASFLGMG